MLLFNASMARLFLASRTFITWNQSLTFCGHLHLNWITHLCHNKIVFAKLVLDSAHIICDLQRYVSAQLHYLLRWWDTGIRCVPLYDHANWSNGSYHLTIPFAYITVRIYPLGKLLKFLTLSNITVAWEIRIDVSLVEPKFPACPWNPSPIPHTSRRFQIRHRPAVFADTDWHSSRVMWTSPLQNGMN